jgi:hypothetical protein
MVDSTFKGKSGRYDKEAGGRKVWGNPNQGDSMKAEEYDYDNYDKCYEKQMYVVVTNIGSKVISS